MSIAPVLCTVDSRGVAEVRLNRPEVGNAYNGELIDGLLDTMDNLATQDGLRAVVLKGNGRHFQAGADLAWIRSVSRSSVVPLRKRSTGSIA
jgi:methylglutaconyl-CoA hydratase